MCVYIFIQYIFLQFYTFVKSHELYAPSGSVHVRFFFSLTTVINVFYLEQLQLNREHVSQQSAPPPAPPQPSVSHRLIHELHVKFEASELTLR